MNIKALALGSVLALGSIFGGVSSAEAASATCWIGAPNQTASAEYCDHYLPEKGEHLIYIDGRTVEFDIYTDGTATISVDGAPKAPATWVYHDKGGIQVTNDHNGWFFIWERN